MFEKEAKERAKDYTDNAKRQVAYECGFLDGVDLGYNKANEWHKADVPTSPINKVVLGYIKHYNSKLPCLVKWNGEWWYDARTYNDRVKLIAWKEIVLPKESEIESEMFPEITLPKGSSEFIDKVIADAEKKLKEKNK